MFKIGRKAAELKRTKLQSEKQKQKSELQRKKLEKNLKMSGKAGDRGGPTRNPKQTKWEPDDDDYFLEDLVVEGDPKPKKPRKYANLKPGGFVTKAEDQKGRLEKRRVKKETTKDDDDDGDDEEEEETEKERLERETKELQSELEKTEKAAEKARYQEECEKAKRFSERIRSGVFLKQLKAISLIQTKKKRKSLKTEKILSADEEDKEDEIPEGFHLQEESLHCLNMQRAEDFQAYLWQLVLEFEKMLKAGGIDMRAEYGKVIESFYWACKANKQTICNDAKPDEVLASIKDPLCKAWKLKLTGKESVDPTNLIPEPLVAPQKALDAVSFKNPDEILEAVKEELAGKTPVQMKELKIMIANLCRSQALAHRHAADAADHLATLTEIASLPVVMTVRNSCQRPVVAVKIPEVDEMLQRAQDKVDAIKRVKSMTAGARPIDEVVFAQNVSSYNPEWQHSNEGKAVSYLAMLVCRYMNELQRKDKKVVLSAKALEAIYHTASSSVGKLISGKQYLGSYAMEQQRGKAEVEGKELQYLQQVELGENKRVWRRIAKLAENVHEKGNRVRKIKKKFEKNENI